MKLINALGKAIASVIVFVLGASIVISALFLVASGLMALGLIEPVAVVSSFIICFTIALTVIFLLEDRK